MQTQVMTQVPLAETAAARMVVGEPFRRRAWAYVIDIAILFVANAAVAFVAAIMAVLFLAVLRGGVLSTPRSASGAPDWLVGTILTTVYFVLYEWLFGASPGKAILRMRVVRHDGVRCGLLAAIVRSLLRFVDGLFFGLIAYNSMKYPLYQRVGDNAAHTVVTSAQDPAIQAHRSWIWFVIASVLYAAIVWIYYFFYSIAIYSLR